jgi:hypothetical protein
VAIDTRDKRASLLFGVFPLADGSTDEPDRRHLLGLYRFGDDGPTPEPAPDDLVTACWIALSPAAALVAAFGKESWLWTEEVPKGESLPYATIEQVAAKTEILTWRGDTMSTGLVSVICYAASNRDAATLAQAVRDALRLTAITVQGRTTRRIFVEGGESDYLGRGPRGEEVHIESADFEVKWPGRLP